MASDRQDVFWKWGCLLVLGLAVIFLVVLITPPKRVEAEDVVRLMYEFETPEELASNQEELQKVLTPSEFNRLTVDNKLRAVNTYFKFGYSSSRIRVVEKAPNYVLYTIENENIPSYALWVFHCRLRNDGKIDSIVEYQLLGERGTGGLN